MYNAIVVDAKCLPIQYKAYITTYYIPKYTSDLLVACSTTNSTDETFGIPRKETTLDFLCCWRSHW